MPLSYWAKRNEQQTGEDDLKTTLYNAFSLLGTRTAYCETKLK